MSIEDIKYDGLSNLLALDTSIRDEIRDSYYKGFIGENEVKQIYAVKKRQLLELAINDGAIKSVVALCKYKELTFKRIESVQVEYDSMLEKGSSQFARSLSEASMKALKNHSLLSKLLELINPNDYPQTFAYVVKDMGLVKKQLLTKEQVLLPHKIAPKDWAKIAAQYDLKDMFVANFSIMAQKTGSEAMSKDDALELIEVARYYSYGKILPFIAGAIVEGELEIEGITDLELLDACMNREYQHSDGSKSFIAGFRGSHVVFEDGRSIKDVAKDIGNMGLVQHLEANYPTRPAYKTKSPLDMKIFEVAEIVELEELERQVEQDKKKFAIKIPKTKNYAGFEHDSGLGGSSSEGASGSDGEAYDSGCEVFGFGISGHHRNTLPYDEVVFVGEC